MYHVRKGTEMRWQRTSTVILATAFGRTSRRPTCGCNGDLIQPGDSILTVIESCGKPDWSENQLNVYSARTSTSLYYRGEHGERDRKAVISEGEVERIEALD